MMKPFERWVLVPVGRLGSVPLSSVGNMGRMGIFLGQSLFYAFATPVKFFRVLRQIRFIGFGSLLVIVPD